MFNLPAWTWVLFSSCSETQAPTDFVWPPVGITAKPDYSVWLIPLIIIFMATIAGGCALATWYKRKPRKLTYLFLISVAFLLIIVVAQQWHVFSRLSSDFNAMSTEYYLFLGSYLRNVLICLAVVGINVVTLRFCPSRLWQGTIMAITILQLIGLIFAGLALTYALLQCSF
jgi:hypothetical protein